MTSKERAALRAIGHSLEPIVQVGHEGISPQLTKNLDDALTAHELVKINVQKNLTMPVKDVAETLSERTHAHIIQVIGRKIILYRYSTECKQHVQYRS